MRNTVNTSEYQDYRNKLNYVFDNEYLKNIRTKELSQDLSLKISSYQDYSQKNIPYCINCTLAQLINHEDEVLCSIKNINNDGEFFDLIEHQNGNRYLAFRIDLYGYSILDLNSMKAYHYIPEESFHGGETFIWTGTHYNKNTNVLIVEGCYWACPYGIFIVDFTEPENIPYPEYDLNDYLNYDNYESLEFEYWDDKDNLIIKCYDYKAEKYINKIIDKDVYCSMIGK